MDDGDRRARTTDEEVLAALDHLNELVYVFDADGTFEYWNDTLLDVTGYSEDEIAAMGPAEFFTQPDRMPIKEAITRALTGEYVRVEATLETRDGDRIPYEFSGVSFAEDGRTLVAGVGRGISERRRREEERQLYQNACNSALTGIAIGSLEGEIRTVNPRFLEMWGYEDEAAVVGTPVSDFWSRPEAAEQVAAAVREDGRWEGELLAERADGSTFHARCSASLVTDQDGEPASMMASFVDVSDRVSRERELERTNEQLEEFASVVSHDLRNPLNVATGRIQLAREGADGDHLDPALDALERMEAIISDTLVLARNGQPVADQETIPVHSLAEQCWGMVETAGFTLDVEGAFALSADRDRLQHVLENLFRNAVDHGSTGGTVRIGPIDDRGFYVEDDGHGIPPADRETVLDPGYTTGTEGTGFGLSIVNRIAQAHGWDLTITDGTDGGARLEFTNVDVERPVDAG